MNVMIYPFIYTRTKYRDYRILTMSVLRDVPLEQIRLFRSIARGLINVEDDVLESPSWVLIKHNGLTLWGIVCMNHLLGDLSTDYDRRPIRGFFGIILSNENARRIPSSVEFFRKLYAEYVVPIWESRSEEDSVTHTLTFDMEGSFIEAFGNETGVNTDVCECRYFPAATDHKALIAEILNSSCPNSIAVNIHDNKQLLPDGNSDFSFMNVIMDSKHSPRCIQTVETKKRILQSDICCDNSVVTTYVSQNSVAGICADIESKSKKKKLTKSLVRACLVAICIVLILEGDAIWGYLLEDEIGVDHMEDSLNIRIDNSRMVIPTGLNYEPVDTINMKQHNLKH